MTADWRRLFGVACGLIEQAGIGADWSFGGGTALMLQIGHRSSHDVDIFIDDPQFLGYLDPANQDFALDMPPQGYHGDGSRFLKITFNIGEIDFIAAPSLTLEPTSERHVLGRPVRVETVSEIVTKKVVYRGSMIAPRDIFDIAAAARSHRTPIVHALGRFPENVEVAIQSLRSTNPDYIRTVIGDLQIFPEFTELAADAIDLALGVLVDALHAQSGEG